MGFESALEVLALHADSNGKLLKAQRVYAKSLWSAVPGEWGRLGNGSRMGGVFKKFEGTRGLTR